MMTAKPTTPMPLTPAAPKPEVSLAAVSLPARPMTEATRYTLTEAGRAALDEALATLDTSYDNVRWASLSPLAYRTRARNEWVQWRREERILWDAATAYLFRQVWSRGAFSPAPVRIGNQVYDEWFQRPTWYKFTPRRRAYLLAVQLAHRMTFRLWYRTRGAHMNWAEFDAIADRAIDRLLMLARTVAARETGLDKIGSDRTGLDTMY